MRKTPDPEMRWLKKLLPIAQSYGHAVVHNELVFFLNPKHRGENFKWANFVDLCVRSAERSVWQSFSTRDWNRYKDQIMDAAKRSARSAASYAMKTSGLLDSDAETSLPDVSWQDEAISLGWLLHRRPDGSVGISKGAPNGVRMFDVNADGRPCYFDGDPMSVADFWEQLRT